MIKTLKCAVLVGALALVATPAFAQLELPIVGVLPTPGNGLDLDPLHIFTPAPPDAPAAPAPMMKHHHHKKMMMKKNDDEKEDDDAQEDDEEVSPGAVLASRVERTKAKGPHVSAGLFVCASAGVVRRPSPSACRSRRPW